MSNGVRNDSTEIQTESPSTTESVVLNVDIESLRNSQHLASFDGESFNLKFTHRQIANAVHGQIAMSFRLCTHM